MESSISSIRSDDDQPFYWESTPNVGGRRQLQFEEPDGIDDQSRSAWQAVKGFFKAPTAQERIAANQRQIEREKQSYVERSREIEGAQPQTEVYEHRGQMRTRFTSEVPVSGKGRVGRIIGGVAGVLGAAAAFPVTVGAALTREGRQAIGTGLSETFRAGWNGSVTRTMDVANVSDADRSRKEREVGYSRNPSTEALKRYVAEHEDQLLHRNGHQFLLNPRNSSFIFIPNGERDKMFEMKVWKTATGDSVGGGTLLSKGANMFALHYNSIDESEQAAGHSYNHYVFDLSCDMIRGHDSVTKRIEIGGKTVLKDRRLSVFNGHKIETKDDVWKDVHALFDPEKTEKKQSLEQQVHPEGRAQRNQHPDRKRDLPDVNSDGDDDNNPIVPPQPPQSNNSENDLFVKEGLGDFASPQVNRVNAGGDFLDNLPEDLFEHQGQANRAPKPQPHHTPPQSQWEQDAAQRRRKFQTSQLKDKPQPFGPTIVNSGTMPRPNDSGLPPTTITPVDDED